MDLSAVLLVSILGTERATQGPLFSGDPSNPGPVTFDNGAGLKISFASGRKKKALTKTHKIFKARVLNLVRE